MHPEQESIYIVSRWVVVVPRGGQASEQTRTTFCSSLFTITQIYPIGS
jgi:hypothetical protein